MTMINDVADFHRAMGAPVLTRPAVPSDERIELRERLISEEYAELMTAMGYGEYHSDMGAGWARLPDATTNLPETADAIADLIYVLIGTAHEFGIPLEAVWAEVQRSNMAKLGPDGKPVVREDGKITKPEGWTAPDIEGVLVAHGWKSPE